MKKNELYKITMASLAIIDIALIILDYAAFININTASNIWFWLNNLILVVFAVDYFNRLSKAKDKKIFFKTHIFDLLAIIPVGLTFSWMKLAQLGDVGLYFRLLRLIRLAGLVGKLREIFHTNVILYVFYFGVTFLILGSVAISVTEHVSLDKAFWWAMTTASTVGYGDISTKTIAPHTLIGKFTTLITILVGVGIMGTVTSSITTYFMRKRDKQEDKFTQIMHKLDELEEQNYQMRNELEELKKREGRK